MRAASLSEHHVVVPCSKTGYSKLVLPRSACHGEQSKTGYSKLVLPRSACHGEQSKTCLQHGIGDVGQSKM